LFDARSARNIEQPKLGLEAFPGELLLRRLAARGVARPVRMT